MPCRHRTVVKCREVGADVQTMRLEDLAQVTSAWASPALLYC
jgi:hypothetical protein